MSKRFAITALVAVVTSVLPAMAQDAQVGKEYQITIESEQENQYIGAYGQAKMGSVFVLVPNAKKDQKYKVNITGYKAEPVHEIRSRLLAPSNKSTAIEN